MVWEGEEVVGSRIESVDQLVLAVGFPEELLKIGWNSGYVEGSGFLIEEQR